VAWACSDDEVDAHVAAHEEILSQYVDLNLDLMNKLRLLSRAEILAMVRRWVTGHIVSYDLRMRDLLAN
jgi:hemerythrin